MTNFALDTFPAANRLTRSEPWWRGQARLAAFDWLAGNPMPTRQDEAWRYTPVDQLVALAAGARSRPGTDIDARTVDLMAGDHEGLRLVFVNGMFAPGPSRTQVVPGGSVSPFSQLGPDTPGGPVLEVHRLDGFLAANWVAGTDGAAISIAAGHIEPAPIHVVHVAEPGHGADLITHPSTVIHVHPAARATVIESYVGFDGVALTNAATVIHVSDGGSLTYHRVQTEATTSSHVGHIRGRIGPSAHLAATSFTIGAATSRVAFDLTAYGDGSSIDAAGLYLPSGDEHHDHVVTIEHLASHTTSEERFKGVIDDRARGSFTGHVVVPPGVLDTTAHQTNRNLLLTSTAEADSRPWLEILADDVRCTHGATVGRLDDEALFYLRSRGIPEAAARILLIDAFLGDIIDDAEPETLRRHLRRSVAAKPRHPRRTP